MPTSFPMPIPNAPTGFVNQAGLDAAFSTPINDLYALLAARGQGLISSTLAGSPVTLSTTSSFATSSVTFTLATQRRIQIKILATFTMTSGTSGHYFARAGYNSGASVVLGSFVGVGNLGNTTLTVAGANGAVSIYTEGEDLLPAGTYTAYGAVQRSANGTVTDTASAFYISAYDVGSV